MAGRVTLRFTLFFKRSLQALLIFSASVAAGSTLLIVFVSAPPELSRDKANVINDISRLNPISVRAVRQPRSVREVVAIIQESKGPISIGGARHSMGGQIGSEGTTHLDMRGLDQIISFDKTTRQITVQSGITWRKIQEAIDPEDLSIMIMQTYADFTVGGSISVNAHGRYVGYGPLVHSVLSIKVVLPDGRIVNASRKENVDLFSGCVGGYGGLGVIVEATLQLAENSKLERQVQLMKVADYPDFFAKNIRSHPGVVFHNADLYPDDYTEVRAISYVKTDKPLTVTDRLKPLHKDYRADRLAMWILSEMPFGNWLRKNWADPLTYKNPVVEWRNYEASYDAMELEPSSRERQTYILQEYFVPVERFGSFLPRMRSLFQEHRVNVINVSIRHAYPDTISLLNWAPTEVFCFVVYYKQGTSEEEKSRTQAWTRGLIDAVLMENGSYYLPYQIHGTREQFQKAYPRAKEFSRLKKQVDPANRFRNRLWDAYYAG